MQYDKQTREDMYRTIASWKQSGLSQKAYCEQNNICYYVFHYWYKRYRNQQGAVNDNPFIPLDIKSASRLPACSANIEMILADGKRILFHQPVSSDFLKALIS